MASTEEVSVVDSLVSETISGVTDGVVSVWRTVVVRNGDRRLDGIEKSAVVFSVVGATGDETDVLTEGRDVVGVPGVCVGRDSSGVGDGSSRFTAGAVSVGVTGAASVTSGADSTSGCGLGRGKEGGSGCGRPSGLTSWGADPRSRRGNKWPTTRTGSSSSGDCSSSSGSTP